MSRCELVSDRRRRGRSPRRCRRASRSARGQSFPPRGLRAAARGGDLPSRPRAEPSGSGIGRRPLVQYSLVFRDRNSSAQRALDKAFRAANLQPTPALVVNTREGMLEAVAHRLGVGFIWEHGSSRVDRIAKVAVAEMEDAARRNISFRSPASAASWSNCSTTRRHGVARRWHHVLTAPPPRKHHMNEAPRPRPKLADTVIAPTVKLRESANRQMLRDPRRHLRRVFAARRFLLSRPRLHGWGCRDRPVLRDRSTSPDRRTEPSDRPSVAASFHLLPRILFRERRA